MQSVLQTDPIPSVQGYWWMTQEERYEQLAYLAYCLMEGGDVSERILSILRGGGFVDEDDEWIYPWDSNEWTSLDLSHTSYYRSGWLLVLVQQSWTDDQLSQMVSGRRQFGCATRCVGHPFNLHKGTD